MEKINSRPPTLTRRIMARQIRNLHPQFPPEVIEAAIREIITASASALVAGRPLVLRSFGRFSPRRYLGSTKKRGLLFHAAPGLIARLNPKRAEKRES